MWLLVLIVVAGAWSAGARSAAAGGPGPAAELRPPVRGVSLDAPHADFGEPAAPRVDLYGNQIEEAVTDYRVDFYGDIYERHSPETAVVELTAPSL
jgi:hypothetical protein